MPGPDPFAHQWSGLIPLPMNRTANRLGNGVGSPAGAASAAPPQTGIDSSHGRAIPTPAPRRMVRRSIFAGRDVMGTSWSGVVRIEGGSDGPSNKTKRIDSLARIVPAAPVEEQGAGDDRLDQGA